VYALISLPHALLHEIFRAHLYPPRISLHARLPPQGVHYIEGQAHQCEKHSKLTHQGPLTGLCPRLVATLSSSWSRRGVDDGDDRQYKAKMVARSDEVRFWPVPPMLLTSIAGTGDGGKFNGKRTWLVGNVTSFGPVCLALCRDLKALRRGRVPSMLTAPKSRTTVRVREREVGPRLVRVLPRRTARRRSIVGSLGAYMGYGARSSNSISMLIRIWLEKGR
jgi:hypothetical protein